MSDPGNLEKKQPKGVHVPQLTFVEALAQLQAAHRRDLEALHKELQRRNRKIERLATGTGESLHAWPQQASEGGQGATIPLRGAAAEASKEACLPGCVPPPPAGDIDPEGGAGQVSDGSTRSLTAQAQTATTRAAAGMNLHDLGGNSPSRFSDMTSESGVSAGSRTGWDASDFAIRWNPFGDGLVMSTIVQSYIGREESRKNRLAYKFVRSWQFSATSYIAILVNSLFIGVNMQMQMDAVMNGRGVQTEEWSQVVEHVFVVFFTFELLCKVLAEDFYVFLGSDWQWNMLDAFLVFAALLQLLMDELYGGDTLNLTLSRTIKLFRITRVLRIVRIVRVIQSLRVMIFAIFRSLDILFWVLAVLLFFKYVFAMVFMHGTISYVDSNPSGGTTLTIDEQQFWDDGQQHFDYLRTSWGSIERAIVTLFESITGGRDWGEVYHSLVKIGVVYGIMFLFYIYFMVFLVLNVVIGTVVDVTSGVAARDRDRMVEDEMKALKDYASDIKEFFRQADADSSGQLSWEEFRIHLDDDRVKAYFQTLDLDIRQAHILFKLLDCNDNGEVGIEEFLDGCLRLRGQAKSLDLNLVIYQLESLIKGSSLIAGDYIPPSTSKKNLRSPPPALG